MVSTVQSSPGRWRFVLTPNRSASWREMQLFFAAVAGVSLTVAGGFAAIGFWPVLPFAGAELALLWLCLHHSASGAGTTEVIDIDERTVAVERGTRAPERRWQFQRAWARVRLVPAPARLHPSRLLLASHGNSVRLGSFLTEDERLELARDLRQALAGN